MQKKTDSAETRTLPFARNIFYSSDAAKIHCALLGNSLILEKQDNLGSKCMNERRRIITRYMMDGIISTWIPDAVCNGAVYYLMNRNSGKSLFGFWIGGTITAFILALICGACLIAPIDKKIKSMAIPKNLFTKENCMVARIMPKKTFGQLLVTAALVTFVFVFVSGLLPLACGFAHRNIPVVTGTIMHGIQCGFMGLMTAYLMLVGRCMK